MGYTTDFSGQFDLNKPLTVAHKNYLEKFAETRRMKRNPDLTDLRDDPLRKEANLPIGVEGGYFVNETGFHGQDHGEDVIDHNGPPRGQPGLWCQWVPSHDGKSIVWDGGEKFYDYVEWLQYIINHFLTPWGYVLNGEVDWVGEDFDDRGKIKVVNNVIKVGTGKWVWEEFR